MLPLGAEKSCFRENSRLRTRGSVRRASGFVQIAIALTEAEKVEAKAQACENA
jgi:hypothetical protein